MVRHIVLWNFVPELSDSEKDEAFDRIKTSLEALLPIIDGVTALTVSRSGFDSSNREIILDSSFESEAALDAYQVHPEHIKCGGYIKTVTSDRICIDF